MVNFCVSWIYQKVKEIMSVLYTVCELFFNNWFAELLIIVRADSYEPAEEHHWGGR